MIYMFLSNNPSSGDINSSNLCYFLFNFVYKNKCCKFCVKMAKNLIQAVGGYVLKMISGR